MLWYHWLRNLWPQLSCTLPIVFNIVLYMNSDSCILVKWESEYLMHNNTFVTQKLSYISWFGYNLMWFALYAICNSSQCHSRIMHLFPGFVKNSPKFVNGLSVAMEIETLLFCCNANGKCAKSVAENVYVSLFQCVLMPGLFYIIYCLCIKDSIHKENICNI